MECLLCTVTWRVQHRVPTVSTVTCRARYGVFTVNTVTCRVQYGVSTVSIVTCRVQYRCLLWVQWTAEHSKAWPAGRSIECLLWVQWPAGHSVECLLWVQWPAGRSMECLLWVQWPAGYSIECLLWVQGPPGRSMGWVLRELYRKLVALSRHSAVLSGAERICFVSVPRNKIQQDLPALGFFDCEL